MSLGSRRQILVAALTSLGALAPGAGCSNVTLETIDMAPPVRDDRLTVTGSFCTPPPAPAEFPVRVLFIVDTSQSMAITDPPPPVCNAMQCFSRRGQAVLDVLGSNPAGNGVSYGLIAFASDSAILTQDPMGQDGFTADGDQVRTKLPMLNNSGGETNYEGALGAAFQMLQSDMIQLGAAERGRARYIVIFLSDGMPAPVTDNFNTPGRIHDKVDAIKSLERDQRLAEVVFHTAYLAGPTTPLEVQLAAKELLSDMAMTGGGTFRTFQSDEPIHFFYIDFTSFVRIFSVKEGGFIATNVNGRSLMEYPEPDSDGDGLLDKDEIEPGTDPHNPDTDGDGFGDLLEVRLRNAGFDPLYPGDADCALPADRLDDDGDGLRNCEERFIGTNPRLMDSDADGMPDDVEFRLGSNPVAYDLNDDPDFDGATNEREIAAHTDPQHDDAAVFSRIAYFYQRPLLRNDTAHPGQRCFDFEVSNITLMPTLAAGGLPEGTNTILLRVAAAPLDAPGDFGDHLIACVRARYIADPELKVPPSGHMMVPPEAFKKPAGDPNDPEVFRADRDCVVP